MYIYTHTCTHYPLSTVPPGYSRGYSPGYSPAYALFAAVGCLSIALWAPLESRNV